MGMHGLAIDNVTQVEVVTADGQVRIVNADDEPDLFWALRGGGGNFGVAASFEFETHPLDVILGGLLAHPLAAAAEVFDMFRQFTKELPDEATVFCGLVHAPDGSGMKLCALPLCHAGELAQAEADLAPLRAFGPPAMDLVQPMPYPVVNTMLDDGVPKGSAQLLEVGVLHRAERRRGADDGRRVRGGAVDHERRWWSSTSTARCAGSTRRRRPTRTASRATTWCSSASGSTRPRPRPTWRGCGRPMPRSEPYMAPKNYVNYLADDESDRVANAYGPNLDRLVEVKRRYDPDNLFRLNHNIDPAG